MKKALGYFSIAILLLGLYLTVTTFAFALTVDSFSGTVLDWSDGNGTCQVDTSNGCQMAVYDADGDLIYDGGFYANVNNYVTYSCAEAPTWGVTDGSFDISLYNVGGGTCGFVDLGTGVTGLWTVVQHHQTIGNVQTTLAAEMVDAYFMGSDTFCYPDSSYCDEPPVDSGTTTPGQISEEYNISTVFFQGFFLFFFVFFGFIFYFKRK